MSKKLTDFFSKKSSDGCNANKELDAVLPTCSRPPSKTFAGSELQYRPQENFDFPKTVSGKQQRSCQHKWFSDFPWLHYDSLNDSVICFTCYTAETKGQLTREPNKDPAYISRGFKSWKKAPKCFREHESSKPHITASSFRTVIPQCADVGEMLVDSLASKRLIQRKYYIKVMECVRYLARQGIPFLGRSNNNNDNFYQLLLLRGSDNPIILEKIKKDESRKRTFKYIHADYQLELLTIMANQVLNMVLSPIKENAIFSLMSDEWTDVSNSEQLSICTRTVDGDLNVSENFLGFYEVPNIKSETIVMAIKDVLIRMQLPLQDCRGQTYDGASNMLGKKSGVAARILKEAPKALSTHCHAHSLSLSLKDTCSNVKILNDTLGTVGEICVLVKYSPKREKMLGSIKDNVDGDLEEDDLHDKESAPSLDKLCVTRWTIRGKCFEKIIENYGVLIKLWEKCLGEGRLSTDVKARIVGCQSQMSTFSFFFGLCLGHRIFMITDNLSKTLQSEKMSGTSSQRLANLTVKTLEGMRTDDNFNLFFEFVTEKASKLPVDEPKLKRKRRTPNYSMLQFIDGQESLSTAHHPVTVEDEFREVYFDTLDHVTTSIKERFDQPSFQVYSKLEELLLHETRSKTFEAGIQQIKELYQDEINISSLQTEFFLFRNMFEEENPACLDDIIKQLKTNQRTERLLIPNIIKVCKLLLVNPATSATAERSFSSARNIKTWQRSTTKAKRFNALSILYIYKEITDKIDFVAVGNEFISKHEERLDIFGKFMYSDLSG